ncbi:MAG: DinB family protein [Balneola sp.]
MSISFNIDEAISILERTPKVLSALLSGLSEEWLYNNEGGSTWSPHQVLGHLLYGEETDWLPRTKIILEFDATKEFEPYDRFAQDRLYADKSPEDLLYLFEKRRAQNLKKLKRMSLSPDDLMRKGKHPEFGEITLKEMLSAWVVHDLGHINQISRVLAKNYKEEIGPWSKYLTVVRSKPAPEV